MWPRRHLWPWKRSLAHTDRNVNFAPTEFVAFEVFHCRCVMLTIHSRAQQKSHYQQHEPCQRHADGVAKSNARLDTGTGTYTSPSVCSRLVASMVSCQVPADGHTIRTARPCAEHEQKINDVFRHVHSPQTPYMRQILAASSITTE
eukprot:COSAG02_NODE_1904_length_10439_cov_157.636267_8_plen_146_part_00